MNDQPHQIDQTSKISASTLLQSSYTSLGSPGDAGKRFIKFLLSNTRTVNALNRILMMDCNNERPSSADSRSTRNEIGGLNRSSMGSRDISLEINAFDLSELEGTFLARF